MPSNKRFWLKCGPIGNDVAKTPTFSDTFLYTSREATKPDIFSWFALNPLKYFLKKGYGTPVGKQIYYFFYCEHDFVHKHMASRAKLPEFSPPFFFNVMPLFNLKLLQQACNTAYPTQYFLESASSPLQTSGTRNWSSPAASSKIVFFDTRSLLAHRCASIPLGTLDTIKNIY